MSESTGAFHQRQNLSGASSSSSSIRSENVSTRSNTNKALPPPPLQDSPPSYPSHPTPHHMHRNTHDHNQERRRIHGTHSHSTPSLLESTNHNHSHGAIASHFLAQPNATYGGQTWVDFLRETGVGDQGQPTSRFNYTSTTQTPQIPHGTFSSQPSSSRFALPSHPPRSSSTAAPSTTERKRRLTTPDSPARRGSGRRTSAIHALGSASNPITLDSPSSSSLSVPTSGPFPPYRQLPPRSSSYGSDNRRRGSNMTDIGLPPWQPDAEVTQCPVCKNQFHFFYRKHHCRKCGRVVCAACSPHRITIPRQYIVHPPSETAENNIIDLVGSDDDNNMSAFGPFRNPALGGGEVVRVCNPCVPDPNFSPPPQPPPYTPRRPEHVDQERHPARGHRASQSANDISNTNTNYPRRPSHNSRDAFARDGISFRDSTRVADLWPPGIQGPSTITSNRPHPGPGSQPSSGFRVPELPVRDVPQHPPRPVRREIAEEDECPVCGNELPPKGLDGDETAREEHINDCISSFAGPPVPSMTSASLPNTRTRGMSDAATMLEGSPGPSNRHSMFARGLFPYTATEKDCLDEEGQQAECVICFEEFEAGDRMARLVCLCSFHEDCIRAWWEKKGRGACPTHQLHEHE